MRRNDLPSAPPQTLGGPKQPLPPTKIAPKPPVKTTHTSGTSQISMDVPNLKNGEDANITGTVRNTGKTAWISTGENPVRLLVRWFDENTGRRFRWELKWLPSDLAPGESAPLTFTITPPRTGKLRLNFAIVRLPGGKYQPASATENDEGLDKIGEKTLRVTVE